MKVMIDTNVVLDVLLAREPHFKASYNVMKLSATGGCDLFISASAATDIYYLLGRSLKNDADARESMEKLLKVLGIADALAQDVYSALASNMPDFEDALVASVAHRCDMSYIVTRDAKGFADSPVKALTPEEFLRYSAGAENLAK